MSVTVWDRITATNQTSLVEDLGDDLGEIEDLAVMDGMTVAPIIVDFWDIWFSPIYRQCPGIGWRRRKSFCHIVRD